MIDNYFNSSNLTPKSAYQLGFIAADGNVFGNRVSIQLKESDLAFLQRLKKDVKAKTKITYNAKVKSYSVNFSSSVMVNDLKEYGIVPCKTFTISYNRIIDKLNNDEDLIRSFLRGYFEGNGCITKDLTELNICANQNFIDEMKADLENRLNIIFKEKNHQNGKSKYIRLFKNKNVLLNYIYKYSSKDYRLERKYKLYREVKEKITNRKVKTNNHKLAA